MCGIAGIIYRNGGGERQVGRDMTAMLQAMKHRGPDSTGYALYRGNVASFVMHVKLSEEKDIDAELEQRMKRQREQVEARMRAAGATIEEVKHTPRTMTIIFGFDGDPKVLADAVEKVRHTEVLSFGHSLEIIKDLGDAQTVSDEYGLGKFTGTHAIGHARMATESIVDVNHSHPFWARPFADVTVVHNGHVTNYHKNRRLYEMRGHRFQTGNDTEFVAVYLADKLAHGVSLDDAVRASIDELDGSFTYLVSTAEGFGVARDRFSTKPCLIAETDSWVAVVSEGIALAEAFGDDVDFKVTELAGGEARAWSHGRGGEPERMAA